SLQAHHRALYGHVHDSGFWREKTDEFLAVARRVIAERVASGAHQLHAAEYLWHGLQVRDEATAVLLRAEKRGVRSEHGRFRLVSWLRELQRFAEALAVLDRLLVERPENLDYRLTKVHTLHALGRAADALQHLEATARMEASSERWHEATIAALANTAVQC